MASRCLSWKQQTLKRHATMNEDVRGGREEVLAAIERLATHGDWDAFQYTLDAYSSCLAETGALAEALELVQMRLRAPHISPQEHGDIVHMLAWINFSMGNYKQSMVVIREAWEQSHTDVPLLISGSYFGAWSAWFSGTWDALSVMLAVSDRGWEESGHQLHLSLASHWATLHIGLAREDRAMIELAASKWRS